MKGSIMDFDQNAGFSDATPPRDLQGNSSPSPASPPPPAPPPPPAGPPVYYPAPAPAPKKRSGWRVFFRIVLVMSILANIFLFFMVIFMGSVFAMGYGGMWTEEVIREGPREIKIAVVSLEGVIYGGVSREMYEQLDAARRDTNVKAVIVRVNSPGGTVSGSDRIYNEIRKFRKSTGKPVVAFMQSVAASGGYYASVACEKIVAEPTTVTGSIGVIAKYFVFEELLESKLGIKPVTVKSGMKKDWPSSTRTPDAEELKYIEEKMIKPAYDRFLSVIAEGRQGVLTAEQIGKLADGSIFNAEEAKEEKLIDDVGYLDDAIALTMSMANLMEARVVEYRKPLSLFGMFGVQRSDPLKIDKRTLIELSKMERMYLWEAY
jgi:protease-4